MEYPVLDNGAVAAFVGEVPIGTFKTAAIARADLSPN